MNKTSENSSVNENNSIKESCSVNESCSADRRPTAGSVKKITSKQVVALIGVFLLVLLYAAALIAAIVDSSASGRLFWTCLYATVVIPILIWVYTWMYGRLTQKHTFADFEPKDGVDTDTEQD